MRAGEDRYVAHYGDIRTIYMDPVYQRGTKYNTNNTRYYYYFIRSYTPCTNNAYIRKYEVDHYSYSSAQYYNYYRYSYVASYTRYYGYYYYYQSYYTQGSGYKYYPLD